MSGPDEDEVADAPGVLSRYFLMLVILLSGFALAGFGFASPTYYAWGYKDGNTIVEGYPTYLRWDNTFQSLASANINNGNWSYLRQDNGTFWTITADDKSFRLLKRAWINYDFEPLKIKETITIETLSALTSRSIVHNATTRYIPLDFSPSIAQTQVGNQLQLGRFKTGEFWIRDNGTSVFDNLTNQTWRNYSYYDVEKHYQLVVVNGEIRLYFDDLTWFQNAKYPLIIDPTWEENSTTGCLGTLVQTVCIHNQVKLNHNQTGLITYFDFEEPSGATAYDYTGTNNATKFNTPLTQTGWYGSGIDLNPNTAFNQYLATNSFLSPLNATILVWRTIRTPQSYARAFEQGGFDATDAGGYALELEGDLKAYSAARTSVTKTAAGATTGVWQNLALTWNNATGTLEAFLNGTSKGTATGVADTTTSAMMIGRAFQTSTNFFNGTIDEFYYYNRVLSSAEINATRDGQVRFQDGNDTSLSLDAGSGNDWKNISVTFTDGGANTSIDLYAAVNDDNATWTFSLIQTDAANNTNYNISTSGRYMQIRRNLKTNDGAYTDILLTTTANAAAGGDTTNPSVTILSPTNTTYNQNWVNLTTTITDNIAVNTTECYYSMDNFVNNQSFNCTYINVTNFADGPHTIYITARDTASPPNYNNTAQVSFTTHRTPTITRHSQNPVDFLSDNLFISSGFNITYNITSPGGVCNVTAGITSNNTIVPCFEYLNGTSECGFEPLTLISNSSNQYIFAQGIGEDIDNTVYPHTENLQDSIFYSTTHSIYSMPKLNDQFKQELWNVSNGTQYNIIEVMVNSTGTTELEMYYCNSTYTTGLVSTSPNCALARTIPATTGFNHTINNSGQNLASFVINTTTGTITGTSVKVTPRSYFVFKPVVTSAAGWSAYYVSTIARVGGAQTTSNRGITFNNLAGTFDLHLHQYSDATHEYDFVNATDCLSGNTNTSIIYNETLDLSPRKPSPPQVLSPIETYYAGTILINYTQSSSPAGSNISFYNISLLNSDFTFNKTIQTNNSLNLTYNWNSIGTADGSYVIAVEATNTPWNLSDTGYSQIFQIDNTPPTVSIITPINTTYNTTSVTLLSLILDSGAGLNAATCRYSIDDWTTNTTFNCIVDSINSLTDGAYTLKLAAADVLGNWNNTQEVSFTIALPPAAPAPSLINQTCIPGTFSLTITAEYNASAYNVSLSINNTEYWNTTSGINFTFNPTGLADNTSYAYNFTAYNSTGNWTFADGYSCTTDLYIPPQPSTWTDDNALYYYVLLLFIGIAIILYLIGRETNDTTTIFISAMLFLGLGLIIATAGINIEAGKTAVTIGAVTTENTDYLTIDDKYTQGLGLIYLMFAIYTSFSIYLKEPEQEDESD